MSKVEVAAVIALCAALASAIGDVIRQRSAHEITDKHVGHLELFRMSLRDKRWWLGGLAAILNYSLQAGALAWGSVVLVTALQVTALLFALPIYARLTHQRVTRWEWIWAIVLAGALAVVIIVGHPSVGQQRGQLSTWIIVGLVMGPALVLCVLGARVWSGRPVAAVLLALVAGSSLALFAVLTKGLVELLEEGLGAALSSPEFVPWLVVMLAGMIFQQSAFRAGALTASLPTMTVAKPLVGGALGVLLLGETFDAEGPEVLVLIGAVVLVVVATVALARGEAASLVAETGLDLKRTEPHAAAHEPPDGEPSPVPPPLGGASPTAPEGSRAIT